jgi:hypothetical protein
VWFRVGMLLALHNLDLGLMKIDKSEFWALPGCVKISRFCRTHNKLSDPVAGRPKAWVCDRWLVRMAGSNTAGNMDVCTL